MGDIIENFRLPRPIDNRVLELKGTKIQVTGTVIGEYRGGAVVEFPMLGGGAIGIPTKTEGAIGDKITLDVTVIEATGDSIKILFPIDGQSGQEAILERSALE